MSDPRYKDQDLVWCKCGGLFWPAEAKSLESLPEEIREGFLWMPKVVVKFFGEDSYEFIKNDNHIFPYNCDRKEEFIKKGLARFRGKVKEGSTGGWFAKFPEDVIKCEERVGGDVNILDKPPFAENKEKVDYSKIFGDGTPVKKGKSKASGKKEPSPVKKEPSPVKRGINVSLQKKKGTKRKSEQTQSKAKSVKRTKTETASTAERAKEVAGNSFSSDHKVTIMTQPSTPYHIDMQKKVETPPSQAGYRCQTCGFTATRLNVFILHTKSHTEQPKAKPSPSKVAKGRKALISSKVKADIKKPRISKKKKVEPTQDQVRREEEKKKILGEWSEDESEEEEEIKKLTGSVDNDEDNSDDDFFNFDDNRSDDLTEDASPVVVETPDNDLSKSSENTPKPTCSQDPVSPFVESSSLSSIKTKNKSPEAC